MPDAKAPPAALTRRKTPDVDTFLHCVFVKVADELIPLLRSKKTFTEHDVAKLARLLGMLLTIKRAAPRRRGKHKEEETTFDDIVETPNADQDRPQ